MCGYGGLQTRDIGKTFEAVEIQRITEAKTLSKARSLSSSCSCLQEECTVLGGRGGLVARLTRTPTCGGPTTNLSLDQMMASSIQT